MAPSRREYDRQLLAAVEQLAQENGWPRGRVIAAVAHAKHNARELYAACDLDLPAPEDYATMIIASARHRLNRDK